MIVKLDGLDQNMVIREAVTELKKELVPAVVSMIKAETKPDVINKKTMCAEVLSCDTTTYDNYYQYQPGFPYMYKGKNKAFSRRAVQKWIDENQRYVKGVNEI